VTTPPLTEATESRIEVVFDTSATIENTILYNENGLVITATGLTYNYYYAEIKLQFENNTDYDYQFISSSNGYHCNSVNGIMTPGEGYVNCTVKSGSTAYDTARFQFSSLKRLGITCLADIELAFDITNNSEQIYSQPIAINTSLSNMYDYSKNHYQQFVEDGTLEGMLGVELLFYETEERYSQDGIKVISNALLENEDGDVILLVEAENTSNKPVNIFVKDISVDNFLIYSYNCDDTTIAPGKRCVLDVNISKLIKEPYWDLYGITGFESLKYCVKLKDMQYMEITDPKTVTIQPHIGVTVEKSFQELYIENGIQILLGGIVDEDNEYTDDLNAVIIINNQTEKDLKVEIVDEAVLVNGILVEIPYTHKSIPAGQQVPFIFELRDEDMEELGTTDPNAIDSLEFVLKIKDTKYNEVAEPTIVMDFAH
jgi:hypothetical protein